MTDFSPNHHLPDTLIQAYAAGTLCEAFSLVVACHISLCDSCRASLGAVEALGGAILDETPTAPMMPEAFADVMARIENEPQPVTPTVAPSASVFPAPLQDYAGANPEATRWRSVGGGVRQAMLDVSGSETARLLYIPAGKAVPEHTHDGLELTLVLQGAFSDKVAQFKRGDLEIGDGDLDHQPIADEGLDCICLAASDAPLRFKGLLPRIMQPFIGI